MKQLATKEFQIEKACMEKWKQIVMTEVALKLQGMKQMYIEEIVIES